MINRRFFGATATLIGTIVGVGIFGVPYVVAKSGFLIGLILLFVLSATALLLHLIYGEIVLRTPGKHRYVGYADIYLGQWGKRLTTFTSIFIFYGALLSYLIVGGKFLQTIFGGSELFWGLIFFAICSSAIFFGLRVISQMEIMMSLFLMIVIILIFFKGWPALEWTNLTTLDWRYFLLPYGAILWAATGWTAIPEMKEIFKQKCGLFKKAIIWGTLLPAFLHFLFVMTVVGVTGGRTSPEAINGLVEFLENHTVIWGAVFGILAVATSFLIIGLALKKVYWYDYKINKHLSWVLTCFIPLAIYLFYIRDFVLVISFLGATLCGFNGILLVLIHHKARKKGQRQPEYSLKLHPAFYYGLITILTTGIIYQIICVF
jgi:tyrosine-specific transport protein